MWRITIEADEDKIASKVIRLLRRIRGIKLNYQNIESGTKEEYYGGD